MSVKTVELQRSYRVHGGSSYVAGERITLAAEEAERLCAEGIATPVAPPIAPPEKKAVGRPPQHRMVTGAPVTKGVEG